MKWIVGGLLTLAVIAIIWIVTMAVNQENSYEQAHPCIKSHTEQQLYYIWVGKVMVPEYETVTVCDKRQ